jgi:hypothetical protein
MGFRCDIHGVEVDDIFKWRDHLGEVEHETTGVTLCSHCGKTGVTVKHTGKLHGAKTAPAYCTECKTKLLEDLKQ